MASSKARTETKMIRITHARTTRISILQKHVIENVPEETSLIAKLLCDTVIVSQLSLESECCLKLF
jgi:hypothetical protein